MYNIILRSKTFPCSVFGIAYQQVTVQMHAGDALLFPMIPILA